MKIVEGEDVNKWRAIWAGDGLEALIAAMQAFLHFPLSQIAFASNPCWSIF